MNRCKKCVLPDTRPGVKFTDGVCQACTNAEKKRDIDWDSRFKELQDLCDKYRSDGYYDCIIPVSGGKDSHYQVYIMKEVMKMNPLLLTVGDPFTKTKAGIHNIKNISERFNCDHMIFNLSTDLFRRVTRIGFEDTGEPLKFVEAAIYTVPLKIATQLRIPLVVFGENPDYEYGSPVNETMMGNSYIYDIIKKIDVDYWLSKGIKLKEMNSIIPAIGMQPLVVFMSYFTKWDGFEHVELMKEYGFRTLKGEWDREGFIEYYDQIDSIAYLIHTWLKYPKFGHHRATDVSCYWIRDGRITREQGMEYVKEHDHKLDPIVVKDFLDFTGYTKKEFHTILDKFYNRNLFEKVGDKWILKKN